MILEIIVALSLGQGVSNVGPSSTESATSGPISVTVSGDTLQATLNQIPKYIRHQVTVNLGAANYTGATISGFYIDPNGGSLEIKGAALTAVTPTTGSATGTATAGSAGANQGLTAGTLTDSGATWTSADSAMLGQFIVITGGTGSGQTRTIAKNTGTVITIAGTWATAPDNTSVYVIQKAASIINASAAMPSTIYSDVSTTAINSGLNIIDNVSNGNQNANFYISNLAINLGASTFAVYERQPAGYVEFKNITVKPTAGTNIQIQVMAGGFLGNNLAINGATATGATALTNANVLLVVTAEIPTGVPFANVGFLNSQIINFSTGTGLNMGANATTLWFGGYIYNTKNAVSSSTGTGNHNFLGLLVDCNSISSSIGASVGSFQIQRWNNDDVSNCTTGYSLSAMSNVILGSVVSGTGNTTAVSASGGASMQLGSSVTLTGTTEITLDSSNNFTIATMRAGTPKSVSIAGVGTKVFQ